MKNKFLLSAIGLAICFFSSVAISDVKITNINGQEVVIPSPYSSKSYDGVPDIYNAISVGDHEFINNVLSQDPDLLKRYNNSSPEEIIGFDAFDIDTINIVLKSDPDLLSRLQPKNGRNLASSMMVEHWDELTHAEDIEYFKKYEDGIKALGIKLRPNKTLLKKDKKLLNNIALASLAYMPKEALNAKDTFGNTSLHYAVGRNMTDVVSFLLNNKDFLASSAFNIYGETAIFMLADSSCPIDETNKKEAQDVLRMLLDSKTSLFQKNMTGFSFPAMVYALPNLEHLTVVLEEKVPESYLNLFKREAEYVKVDLKKNGTEKLYTSIQGNGYWSNACRHFEEKDSKKDKPRMEEGRYKLNVR